MDDDIVKAELVRLREDLHDYHEDSRQQELGRRIENIQVLIALAVVGASISIYSSRVIDTPFWQAVVESSYWSVVIFAFVTANTLFLILKLLTIPLQQLSNNQLLSYVHDFVEPFLYFFAVAGALFAITVGSALAVVPTNITQHEQILFAVASFILPFVFALMYAQAYRLNISLERYQESLLEINRTLSIFVAVGAITAEEQSKLLHQLAFLLLPIPNILSTTYIRLIRDIAQRFGLISNSFAEQLGNSSRILNDYLNELLIGRRYPRGVTSWLEIWSGLLSTQQRNKIMSREQAKELRSELTYLRNKAAHGQLNEEDLDELRNFLSRYDLEPESDTCEEQNEEADSEDSTQ